MSEALGLAWAILKAPQSPEEEAAYYAEARKRWLVEEARRKQQGVPPQEGQPPGSYYYGEKEYPEGGPAGAPAGTPHPGDICPECRGPMEGGQCTNCGLTMEDIMAAAERLGAEAGGGGE